MSQSIVHHEGTEVSPHGFVSVAAGVGVIDEVLLCLPDQELLILQVYIRICSLSGCQFILLLTHLSNITNKVCVCLAVALEISIVEG